MGGGLSASIVIMAAAELARDSWQRPIRPAARADGAAAARVALFEAEAITILGNPPVFGYFDASGFLAPAEQFADPNVAPAVGAEALRTALSSSGAVGRIENACLLDDAGSHDLWHWTAEQLPKALLLEAGGFSGDYLIPVRLPQARAALALAGIDAARIVVRDQRLTAVDCLTFTAPLSRLDLADAPALVERLQAIRARLPMPSPRDPEIVFIQYGDTRFVKYAYYQAISQGYDAVIVGDDAMRAVKHARFESQEAFSEQAVRFAGIYRHLSVNRVAPELLCFQRWFILRDYMARSGRSAVLLDHDILVYPDLLALAHHAQAHAMLDTSWINLLATPACVDGFCRFIWDVYSNPDELVRLARIYTMDGTPNTAPQLSDMILLIEYGRRRPDLVLPFTRRGVALGFDNNIRAADGYVTAGGLKALEFVAGAPYCRRPDGSRQQFRTLHFQGVAKLLMEQLHTITDPRHLAELDPLESGILELAGIPVPDRFGVH